MGDEGRCELFLEEGVDALQGDERYACQTSVHQMADAQRAGLALVKGELDRNSVSADKFSTLSRAPTTSPTLP